MPQVDYRMGEEDWKTNIKDSFKTWKENSTHRQGPLNTESVHKYEDEGMGSRHLWIRSPGPIHWQSHCINRKILAPNSIPPPTTGLAHGNVFEVVLKCRHPRLLSHRLGILWTLTHRAIRDYFNSVQVCRNCLIHDSIHF
jgi:hypothetical protein